MKNTSQSDKHIKPIYNLRNQLNEVVPQLLDNLYIFQIIFEHFTADFYNYNISIDFSKQFFRPLQVYIVHEFWEPN